MTDTTLLIAILAMISAIASPMTLAWLTGRQRRADKREDWARQDAVADQAAVAAKLLLAENKKVAAASVVTHNKLDVIHTLVNSSMTAAMQSELDATVRELAMMKEVVTLKQATGIDPSVDALAAIESTTDRVGELRAGLSDRLRQSLIVDEQVANQTAARVVIVPGVED